MTIEVVFAESARAVPQERIDNVRRYFPEATITYINKIYAASRPVNLGGEEHPRYGWRYNDYWKARAMLESTADVCIAMDADMRIVSDDVRTIIPLATRFGLCLPANPRHLVRVDTQIGADSDGVLDETNGTGYAYNCAFMACGSDKHSKLGRWVIRHFMDQMESNPVRGPLAWWRAVYFSGHVPYMLPPQWCVCERDIGCGSEIVLHEGHELVKRTYERMYPR